MAGPDVFAALKICFFPARAVPDPRQSLHCSGGKPLKGFKEIYGSMGPYSKELLLTSPKPHGLLGRWNKTSLHGRPDRSCMRFQSRLQTSHKQNKELKVQFEVGFYMFLLAGRTAVPKSCDSLFILRCSGLGMDQIAGPQKKWMAA